MKKYLIIACLLVVGLVSTGCNKKQEISLVENKESNNINLVFKSVSEEDEDGQKTIVLQVEDEKTNLNDLMIAYSGNDKTKEEDFQKMKMEKVDCDKVPLKISENIEIVSDCFLVNPGVEGKDEDFYNNGEKQGLVILEFSEDLFEGYEEKLNQGEINPFGSDIEDNLNIFRLYDFETEEELWKEWLGIWEDKEDNKIFTMLPYFEGYYFIGYRK